MPLPVPHPQQLIGTVERNSPAAIRGASLVVKGRRPRARELVVATGRMPTTDGIGLTSVGLEPGAPLVVDDELRVTGVDGDWLYAAGDVNGRALLTHQGKYEARLVGDIVTRDIGAVAGGALLGGRPRHLSRPGVQASRRQRLPHPGEPTTLDTGAKETWRTTVQEQTATVDDTRMRWLEEGRGTPVVLVHGIPTSPVLWRHVAPRLAGMRVLAWEMTG